MRQYLGEQYDRTYKVSSMGICLEVSGMRSQRVLLLVFEEKVFRQIQVA